MPKIEAICPNLALLATSGAICLRYSYLPFASRELSSFVCLSIFENSKPIIALLNVTIGGNLDNFSLLFLVMLITSVSSHACKYSSEKDPMA